jgi:hypothetical protein
MLASVTKLRACSSEQILSAGIMLLLLLLLLLLLCNSLDSAAALQLT